MSLDSTRRGTFRALFERIGEDATLREAEHRLPYAEIRELAAAGFTAIRVPEEYGGSGASLPELFELLIELAAADPNLPQALRGHLGFTERQLVSATGHEETWLRRIAEGTLIGNSQSEAGATTSIGARVTPDGSGWRLNGRKFYTTGTIFSDYTWTSALAEDDSHLGVIVPLDAPGVTVLDDWDGLGQRLSGSGTTIFEEVPLTDDLVRPAVEEEPWIIVDQRVFFHLLLQAALAGIGEAALRDTIEVVRKRTRSFGSPGQLLPREDPRVHTVIGELASRVAAVRALVLDVARDHEEVRARDHADAASRYDDYVRLQVRQFQVQQIAVTDILRVTSELYEVGGASLVTGSAGLDRHWRNARTIASHNPAIFRKASIGDWLLNGTIPERAFR